MSYCSLNFALYIHTMSRITSHKLIGFCTAGLLVLMSASVARAGFVSPNLELSTHISKEKPGATIAKTPQTPKEKVDIRLFSQDGYFSPNSNSTAGNVNTGPQSGPSSCATVAGFMETGVSGGILSAYLLAEPGIFLPAPFLDGVFRPPQSQPARS